MLAEDIGGWLLAGALFFGAIVATVMAIIAAFPATKGKRLAATILALPGILVGVSSTLYFGYTAILNRRGPGVNEGARFWLFTALPPLIVSGLVILEAWSPRKN